MKRRLNEEFKPNIQYKFFKLQEYEKMNLECLSRYWGLSFTIQNISYL